ncbi:hypothetical protein GCM10011497_14010 [Elstera cyanobacteriorum]|uniref:Uncharacterized protein n=1 Tax=Elstera cyanobacteriorum TaxID=2022747 RepID=A0A255XLH8_9PROT|nr:hypothetical protein [Elstera cyanobacteriorum]OYQ17808.1 hypothetical protein CHR90_12570 [Elstera cyanobacteriorum]GFZ85944.1 hypothetical protein GCM10011497_14010 [Elstera cyanobacteriorum]
MDEAALATFFAQQRLALTEAYLKAGRSFAALSPEDLQNQWRDCFTALADDPSYRPVLELIVQLEAEFSLRGGFPDFTGMDDIMHQLNRNVAAQYQREADADPEMFAEFTANLEAEIEATAIPVPRLQQN